MLITETAVHAQTHLAEAKNSVDSISTYPIDSLPKKRSFFGKILNYFNDANKEKKNKKFDFSIIGGPHYSSDTKFGIGLVAAGLYRTDRNDSILPPSNVISLSPVKAWERIEIQIVVQPVFVLGKQMVSTYSQQIESHFGDIPIQRDKYR